MTAVNLDIISMDLKGTAISAAHAALVSFDALKQGNKIVVLASTADFLSDVENEISEVSSGYDQRPTVACVGPASVPDPNAQILLSLSSEISKLSSEPMQMIIVCEANTIIRLSTSFSMSINQEVKRITLHFADQKFQPASQKRILC
jgi:hypothetical protein